MSEGSNSINFIVIVCFVFLENTGTDIHVYIIKMTLELCVRDPKKIYISF